MCNIFCVLLYMENTNFVPKMHIGHPYLDLLMLMMPEVKRY